MKLVVIVEIDLMIKLYIASRFSNKKAIQTITNALPEEIQVVSTWHNLEDSEDGTREEAIKRDLSELDSATAILLYTDNCEKVPGGMHFEAGYAYALGKRFLLLGPPVNIFCDLAEDVRKIGWKKIIGD